MACGGFVLGGLLGAGVSKLPSDELFELRLFVLDISFSPGGDDVRFDHKLGGGVTCPLRWPRGVDEADLVGVVLEE